MLPKRTFYSPSLLLLTMPFPSWITHELYFTSQALHTLPSVPLDEFTSQFLYKLFIKAFLFFCFCIIGKCSPQTCTEVSHCSNGTYFSWGKKPKTIECGQTAYHSYNKCFLDLSYSLFVWQYLLAWLYHITSDFWTVSAFYFFTHATFM